MGETGLEKRHMGLEYLRILAAYMVVVNHSWFLESGATTSDILVTALVYTVVLIAVPLFVMLSGAFLIPNARNERALSFWRHSFVKLFPLSLPFFLLAFFWESDLWENYADGNYGIFELFIRIIQWLAAGPSFALWYLCMLPGLYFLVPLLARIWQHCSGAMFFCFAMLMYGVWITANYFTVSLPHPFSALLWLGHLTLGAVLLKWAARFDRKMAYITFVLLLLSITAGACWYYYVFSETENIYNILSSVDYPVLAIITPLMFIVFAQWKPRVRQWVIKLSQLTLLIYLVHSPCMKAVRAILYRVGCIEQLHSSWVNNFLFAVTMCFASTVCAYIIHECYICIVRFLGRVAKT